MTSMLVVLVRAYQRLVSPLFPASCRFVPSCSEYAAQALMRYGLVRGAWLSLARELRCNPWAEGGEDPVPEQGASRRGTNCLDSGSSLEEA